MGPEAQKGALTLLAILAAGAGCTKDCEEKADLVAMDAWTLVSSDADPFGPPDTTPCTPDDVRAEPFGAGGPLALDIDTRFGCGWATVSQGTRVPLEPGDAIQVRIFFFSQSTFPADVANLDIRVGDVAFHTSVPIPTSGELVAPLLEVDQVVPEGTAAFFHLGNHGDNSWNLLELSRVRPVFCQ